ncbi:hypothetical protein FRC11_001919, partial [Ceratobasidium sp. 423]
MSDIHGMAPSHQSLSHAGPVAHSQPYAPIDIPFEIDYHAHFHRSGDIKYLDQDIEYKTRALSLKPELEGDPDLLGKLGKSHYCRLQNRGNESDLDYATDYTMRAVSLTPDGHPNMHELLNTLGGCYHQRFHRSNDPKDLEMDIDYRKRAISLKPEQDPSILQALSQSYNSRFVRLGNTMDLDHSIEFAELAVSHTTREGPELFKRLLTLSKAYHERYKRLDDLSDLDKEIECEVRAISLPPEDYPGLPEALNNLALTYSTRHHRLDDMEDLEKAMKYAIRALSLAARAPAGHLYRVKALTNLSLLCHTRFQRLGDPDDLERGMEYNACAFSLTGGNHPVEPLRLQNLSSLYHARFDLLGDPMDLELAIECASRAVHITPDGEGDLADRLSDLGIYFHARWHHQGQEDDLEKDIVYHSRAVSLTPEYHPSLPTRLRFLGKSYLGKLKFAKCQCSYLQTLRLALECLRRCALSEVGHPRLKLECALMWARNGSKLDLNEALNAFQAAVDLIPHVVWMGTTISQRYSNIKELSTLATEAAFVAIAARDYTRALEWLEQSRSIVMNQTLMLRSPLDQLRSVHPSLAEQLKTPGTTDIAHVALATFNLETAYEINSRFNSSIDRGADHPVERGIQRRPLIEKTTTTEDVLSILWVDVVKPILDFLGYKPNPPPEQLPHITWCTTGPLSSLPLHAAGIYSTPRDCLSDYAVSSYVPSLTALLASSSTPLPISASILAVGQESTPGHQPLPGTVDELAFVRKHAGETTPCAQLTGSEATTATVLDAMERYTCVHLACHAHQSVGDPTESGFFLHDGMLDLASIMQRSFKNKGLAFLSACQTAMGDEKMPDETVHLASGMLTAGYPSVIATMWSVWDKDAPFVADKVYSKLLKDGKMDFRDSARALHFAVVELRKNIGDENF